MFDYSSMVNAWYKNQDLIREYFNNKETYIDKEKEEKNEKEMKEIATILGIGVGLFVFLFIISTILFIWGLYLLIVYWDQLPTWAAALGVIGLFFFPLITVILVYAIREKKHITSKSSSSPRKKKNKE